MSEALRAQELIMNETEFIGLKSTDNLFRFIEKIYKEYCSAPTETQLLTLIFSLNHLRDWISEGKNWEQIKKIPKNQRDASQVFYDDIHNLPEFKDILKPLCNGLKHFNIKIITEPISGFRAGLGSAGDSLSQKYFTIDGIDSRNLFNKVLQKYRDFFANQHSP